VKFLVNFIFVVVFLVRFCVILVRNGMFYIKTKSSNLVTIFYYVIDIVYIYSWKKMKKIWPILVILYVKSIFFLSHVVFNLTMEWTPRGHRFSSCLFPRAGFLSWLINSWTNFGWYRASVDGKIVTSSNNLLVLGPSINYDEFESPVLRIHTPFWNTIRRDYDHSKSVSQKI
jgi:hypothetical protein